MKKSVLGLFLFILAVSVSAKETVTVVYSWTAADGPANYSRTIIEEANRLHIKDEDLESWYRSQVVKWQQLSYGVKL